MLILPSLFTTRMHNFLLVLRVSVPWDARFALQFLLDMSPALPAGMEERCWTPSQSLAGLLSGSCCSGMSSKQESGILNS